VAAAKGCGFMELPHPPYSPYIAPSDYYLFAALKNELRGNQYVDDSDVKAAVDDYFHNKDSAFFWHGIEMLPNRGTTCIQHDGKYIE
jgi:hypothetical protein